ncbi:MAG: hypothetical protein KGY75_09050, partial [Candidatus Cloacimonetes bacterium]|nr:hypothetical protein [Candidatus Cloacimonadota bacterium]
MEVKVFLKNDSEYEKLHSLKLDGDVYPTGFARMYVIPSELSKIKAADLEYEILKKDIQKYYNDKFGMKVPNGYYTYAEIVDIADSLALNFPDICQKHVYGYSVQGNELGALKISDNVSLQENEAEVMFDGGIHGDEVGCSENVIRFARDLCLQYGDDPTVTDLIDSREIWLYYCVNPDGRINMDRENANGVDLNRDWGYMWDAWGGSPGAYSQPETQALRECMYNRQFVVHTTYHSGTEFISCPWSYRPQQCPDFDHILQLAGVYASTSTYPNLDYGQGCSGMYPINGSSKDSNYGVMGAISWSMEISYSKQPPASEIMMYYNRNYPAMLAMIEYSGYGLEGVVTDSETGETIEAIVFVDDYLPTYTDPAVGDYHKYVLPGTYSITVMANGYETETVDNITVYENNSTVTNIELDPAAEETHYAYKFPASQIPDNNQADEGNTPACLGAPDNINYSIGKDGWCIIDMQFPIVDGPGNDFTVYEGDDTPEGFTCYVGNSIDGPFYSVGNGNGTTEFDISDGGLMEAQFIRINDDGDGSASVANAGFDLDAISAEVIEGPNLVLSDYYIDDSNMGNDNGQLDPDETAQLYLIMKNNGTETVEDINTELYCNDQHISIVDSLTGINNILPDDIDSAYVTISADASTSQGHTTFFNLDVSSNSGIFDHTFLFSLIVGDVPAEGFETGDFTAMDWNMSGNADWIITSTSPYQGDYCAQSGDIDHNQTTELSVNLDVYAGEISFYRKVSSESSYDFLQFYVDGVIQGQWSGNIGWSEVSVPVTAGNHTFKWVYEKDSYVSSGQDCGWIDEITFPPVTPSYPVIAYYPTQLDFGQVTVDEDSTKQFTIQNVGANSINGNIVTPAGYTIEEASSKNQISFSIAAGSSETFDLTFSPASQQSYEGEVIITIPPFQQETIPVSGEGVMFAVDPSSQYYENTALLGNYPNPASDFTRIEYHLKGSINDQNAEIR